MEPELISASGRDMAGDFSGEAVVAGLLMRSGWTWRTILSVCLCEWRLLWWKSRDSVSRDWEGIPTVSIVMRRSDGRGDCYGMRACPRGDTSGAMNQVKRVKR